MALHIGSKASGVHITYTQASPVKAASVAHCLGNRTPHVTHPSFPPPPSRMPRPPWRSCECGTRSARLHKPAGAANPAAAAAAAAATAATTTVAASAVGLLLAAARRVAASPLRTHHLAATPALAALTAVAAAATAAAHLRSCLPHQTRSTLLSLSLATAISIPSCCLLLLPSRSFLLRLLPLPTPLLPARRRSKPPAAQMLMW